MSEKESSNNRVQVIIATMNQKNTSLINHMNLRSDALICNQCGKDSIEKYEINGFTYVYYNSSQLGIGRNRNTGINNASADILLFADDDIIYHDNYVDILENAFDENPNIDMFFFELERINDPRFINRSEHRTNKRVYWHSCLRYGASRLAVRRSSLAKANVWFSILFGGGATFSFGEDSLFISDCIKNGLKAMSINKEIGIVDQSTSSWFKGYNEQYFRDKGSLFYAISKRLYPLLWLNYLIRHKQEYQEFNLKEVVTFMRQGKNHFKSLDA